MTDKQIDPRDAEIARLREALEKIAHRPISQDYGVRAAARMRQDARDALAEARGERDAR